MRRSEKNIALLFAVFTVLCVGLAHLSQAVYQWETLLAAASAFCLFREYGFGPPPEGAGKRDEFFLLALIFLNGTLVRLMIAREGYGNYDSVSWQIAAGIAERGGNIYAETTRYNTSPVWFWTLGLLKKIQGSFPQVSFGFIVRAFLTAIDGLTAAVLLAIVSRRNLPRVPAALFFFLNPVSFILTGYHGQFENLALLFLLIGVLNEHRTARLWFYSTLGFIVKHNIFYETWVALNFAVRRIGPRALLFALSCGLFLASFGPYWKDGTHFIYQRVLLYSSYQLDYGVSTFFRAEWLKAVFIAALVIYPVFLTSRDLVQRLLLGVLFFLTFTTGFGNQYLVLPIALGALRPSKGFFIYSAAAALFLLGDQKSIGWQAFSWVPLNLVWAAAGYWWISEQLNPSRAVPAGLTFSPPGTSS